MTPGEKISCIVGSKNAEKDIGECLESVKWADEIIVVDDFSSDRTIEIAKRYTDKIFQKHLTGYTEQKDFGLQKTSNCWVLSLDADERVTKELEDEIVQKLSSPPEASGFLFRRLNIFLGKPVRHCGWYEANNLRLFDKEKIGYDLTMKYLESMKISGRLDVMEHDLIHYTCRSLDDYVKRMDLWAALNARDLFNKGVRVRPLTCGYYLLLKPAAVFLQKYFLKAGYLDGYVGFLICGLSAVTYFLSYNKLWKMERSSPGGA